MRITWLVEFLMIVYVMLFALTISVPAWVTSVSVVDGKNCIHVTIRNFSSNTIYLCGDEK
jgi:hypothetical protein